MSHPALQRKLHALELAYLRELTAELLAERDALLAERDQLKRDLSWAEDCADRWRDDALRAVEEAAGPGGAIGLTMDGNVIPLRRAA